MRNIGMQRSSLMSASRLSRGPSLKRKQEEVVFAMIMQSYCTNKRQKQLTLSSSDLMTWWKAPSLGDLGSMCKYQLGCSRQLHVCNHGFTLSLSLTNTAVFRSWKYHTFFSCHSLHLLVRNLPHINPCLHTQHECAILSKVCKDENTSAKKQTNKKTIEWI